MTDTAARAGQLGNVAAALNLPIDDRQIDRLLQYLALLQRWNGTYNLTAIRDPRSMLTQHLADCLAIIGPLDRQTGARPVRLLDVGSGGGLPGVVIAAMRPDVDVTCVDAVGKKVAFIRQAAAELRLPNLHAEHSRVEQLRLEPFDVITSRAFGTLGDMARLTAGQLAADGFWMAMKGKVPASEMSQLPPDVAVFHVEQLAVPGLDAERCLVWLRPKTSVLAKL